MKIFTIGFTKTPAKEFFGKLKDSQVKIILDVRLNPNSQLAGFATAKDDNLKFFAKKLCKIDYKQLPGLAPTKEILKGYRQKSKPKGKRDSAWSEYELRFNDLMRERKIENLDRSIFEGACLLCSEHKPNFCHRRLVVEYLKEKWPDVEIEHLVTKSQEKHKA